MVEIVCLVTVIFTGALYDKVHAEIGFIELVCRD